MKKNINTTRDPNTSDMFPTKRGRGRPRKPNALSNAERQRRFRARQKANPRPPALDKLALQLLASTFRDIIEADARADQLVEELRNSNDPHALAMAIQLRQLVAQTTDRFS